MKKNQKYQIAISILLSCLLIGLSSLHFFHILTRITENSQKIVFSTTEKLNQISIVHDEVTNIIQQKSNLYLDKNSLDIRRYNTSIYLIRNAFAKLNQDTTSTSLDIEKISVLQTTTEIITKLSNLNKDFHRTEDELSLILITEKQELDYLVKDIKYIIRHQRDRIIKSNQEKINDSKTITIIIIALALFVILYIIYRITISHSNLKESTQNEIKLNQELKKVTLNLEKSNWIMHQSTLLYEKLSGVHDEKEISKIIIDSISQSMDYYAAAIYVRKIESDEYILQAENGSISNEMINNSFIDGNGILGSVTKSKTIKIIENNKFSEHKIKTTFIKSIPAQIILCPMIHENISFGLLEIIIKFDEAEQSKLLDYLTSITRNIAITIKLSQNYRLVKNLLKETQIQTEELEAQQIELRRTNEKLINKTELLESSEENLYIKQQQLSQTNLELTNKAKELERRNLELNTAHKVVEQKIIEVEQASNYKSEFMANMSHELRTPLNSILILAKLLKDNKNQNLTDDQIKYASVIHSAGSDLLQLINELLDLAKIESGKVELILSTINTSNFVNELSELFREIAAHKNIHFHTNIAANFPIEFISDEYRLQQVLKNFLSNAFKFTKDKGEVLLTIDMISDQIHFSVKDNGKGISPEKKDLIFEAFRQEDGSTNRKYGGTGLGLSISKEIAQLLKGHIILISEIGQGSIFTLSIPYQNMQVHDHLSDNNPSKESIQEVHLITKPRQFSEKIKNDGANSVHPKSNINNKFIPSNILTSETTPILNKETKKNFQKSKADTVGLSNRDNTFESLNNKKVLLVDDDMRNVYALTTSLEVHNMIVDVANNGNEAIDYLEKNQDIDIVLMDIMMPEIDGHEVIKRIRRNDALRNLPIIAITAKAMKGDREKSLQLGANDYVSKPIDFDNLYSLMHIWIK